MDDPKLQKCYFSFEKSKSTSQNITRSLSCEGQKTVKLHKNRFFCNKLNGLIIQEKTLNVFQKH